MRQLIYLLLGIAFGIILSKAEVISWFRIQEMFRFQSFHMYGILGSAVLVGTLSVGIIRWLNIPTVEGEPVDALTPKPLNKAPLIGGVLFGVGWALTGACPGPLYALVGNGYTVMIVPLASAILGTLTYGYLRHRLPH
jgi:uncharacterized membrane protein YedE/YeeE